MWRYAIPLLVLSVLVLFFWRGLSLNPGEVPSPLLGREAPEFTLPALHEPERLVTDMDLVGEVTLFNVWGTWCPGCHEEHEELMRLAQEEGVRIVGLNLRDDREAAIRWLSRVGNPFEVSGFDSDGQVSIDWGVYGAPETFVLDHQGRIRHKHIGPITHDDIDRRLLPLIRGLQEEAKTP
ncbi:DsbE family thiol:disulfide interchange protein [Natronospira bacteriovora]|uniref:DsbE family thiol:disulfide interchange protein n=1 Tax=Natronospira bacteriovora TaxID=3069753 RepID=A0ABU0W9P5_9GAMM|nr:DsbE family thiol:disulfide interchange protein [Natronospira sp. AB-CW4]MDQ2070745.1 DsbE family thiol:disulfide interchange protein [Natronospira sp. AB-CW4]